MYVFEAFLWLRYTPLTPEVALCRILRRSLYYHGLLGKFHSQDSQTSHVIWFWIRCIFRCALTDKQIIRYGIFFLSNVIISEIIFPYQYFSFLTYRLVKKITFEMCAVAQFCEAMYSDFPGGGYSQKNWVGVCGPLPKALTLFMTKICDIPYPIYDLTKNSKPIYDPTLTSKSCFRPAF